MSLRFPDSEMLLFERLKAGVLEVVLEGTRKQLPESVWKRFWGVVSFPSLPNTCWEGVLGRFWGSKHLLRRCLDVFLPKINWEDWADCFFCFCCFFSENKLGRFQKAEQQPPFSIKGYKKHGKTGWEFFVKGFWTVKTEENRWFYSQIYYPHWN